VAGRFITIGHSNRGLEEFTALLGSVEGLADVRAFPRSRTNPQFDRPVLSTALAARGIAYEHVATLGGRRAKANGVSPETNGLWANQSFHNYADYALSAPFLAGLERLLELGREGGCAVMCAEALWWRCHRRIITDYLLAREQAVVHVIGQGVVRPAQLTAGAIVRPDRSVVYPSAR
jgi:uncharacterized protein (DUF488 family)